MSEANIYIFKTQTNDNQLFSATNKDSELIQMNQLRMQLMKISEMASGATSLSR